MYWLKISIINVVVLEVASFLAVTGLGIVSPDRRWDLFLDTELSGLTDATISSFLHGKYDAELGWDNVPSTRMDAHSILNSPWTASYDANGARTSCVATASGAGDAIIATYGDSFTHGDEVNDDTTWECALERRIQRRVANFGVAAYGVDQALLKAERHWRQGRIAPVTLLCVYENDLDRALNRYRPFLSPSTGGKLGFKPSFRRVDNKVVLLPNPLRPEIVTVQEVKGLAVSLIPTDYWASGAARVLPEFPYSVQLFGAVLRTTKRKFDNRRFSDNIWDLPEGREVMLHMLSEFANVARQYGTRPVLLMIPDVSRWKGGRVPPAYKTFLREVRVKTDPHLRVIDVDDVGFNEREFNLAPFRGHASAYGNEIIAQAVLDGLIEDAVFGARPNGNSMGSSVRNGSR
jgi:hypothetical protein